MAKISPKSLGYFFYKKNSPNTIKNRPNGEISPDLVTLSSPYMSMNDSHVFLLAGQKK
jgi:hypothetical protein